MFAEKSTHWILTSLAVLLLGLPAARAADERVAEYLKVVPYQETFDYMMKYTGGDPAKLNAWALGTEPVIPKAGEDAVVRMNNDTFYKIAFMDLSEGPVTLTAKVADPKRFSSFQLMDERNVNFKNVIRPNGAYVLYHGEAPDGVDGELIESPSDIAVVIVRVELKNPKDKADVERAEALFRGIDISGPEIETIEKVDLVGDFDEDIVAAARSQIKKTFAETPFIKLVAGPGDVPNKVSYLQFAAGTLEGWGGPVTSHSSYQTMFVDADGKRLKGANGPYTITTEPPKVGAFWSVTAYNSETGRFFDNPDDRYHINNTTAVPNDDDTVTFTFSTQCGKDDPNCLYVPEGEFDLVGRYYLPDEAIQTGDWTMPLPSNTN